jgi:HlyD family secretion protein
MRVDLTSWGRGWLARSDRRIAVPTGYVTKLVRGLARPRARRWFLAALIPLLALTVPLYWSSRSPSEARHLVTGAVERGPFTVKISESGELRALESVTIASPGKLKNVPIIFLVPEGTTVDEGDKLIGYDPTTSEQLVEEAKTALEAAQADLTKAREDQSAQREKLAADLSRFESDFQLAKIDLENLKKKPLKEELEAARMEVEKAKLAFENAEKGRQVLPHLLQKGYVTRIALEDAELKYLAAKATLQATQFALERIAAGALPEDLERARIRLAHASNGLDTAKAALQSQLQSLQANVDRAKAAVKASETLIAGEQKKLDLVDVRAPRGGLVVYAKPDKVGDKIQTGMVPFRGQPLIYLPDISSMVADTEINEIDIARVQIGGPAELRLEAYPGAVFQGKVHKIGVLARPKLNRATNTPTGIKVFDVTVKVEGKDPRLKPGLTATVDIIVERQADVVSVPLTAVITDKGGPMVLVSTSGKLEKRKVALGASNEQRVIVKEGLRGGERVVLGPPAAPPS